MELSTLLARIRRRPGAYGLSGSYREYVAFLNGCDAIRDGNLFAGLNEWLADKLGKGANLVWWELVRRIVVADNGGEDCQVEEHALVERMFELLEDFSDQRGLT